MEPSKDARAARALRKTRKPTKRAVCASPYFNWLGVGWILYLAGALGYLVLDGLNAVNADISDYTYFWLFFIMAGIYFVDAIAYFLAWIVEAVDKRNHGKIEVVVLDTAAWAEIMYIVSAMFGLIAAGVSLMPVAGTDADPLVQLLSRTVNFLAFVSMLILSNLCYVIDAFLYWTAWYNKRTLTEDKAALPRWWADTYFWADGLLLSIASLGYMATSFVALFAFVEVASRVKNSAGMLQEVVRVLRIARACNVVFDFIYVADAVLYALAWAVDAEARKVAIAEEDALEREIGPSFRL